MVKNISTTNYFIYWVQIPQIMLVVKELTFQSDGLVSMITKAVHL